MARILHWVGVALLFISAILLLITTISAPVIKDIAILKVLLTNQTDIRHSSVIFGTFGHCILDVPPLTTDQDFCFPKTLGYKPAQIMSQIDGPGFSTASSGSTHALTYAMILHPIACALAFIAFLLALIPGILGAMLGSAVTSLAWIVTLVIMAIDFALFGIIKNHVNKDHSGSHAYYSIGMWTILAAMILLFIAMFLVLFSCFSTRKARKNDPSYTSRRSEKHHHDTLPAAATTYETGNTGYATDSYGTTGVGREGAAYNTTGTGVGNTYAHDGYASNTANTNSYGRDVGGGGAAAYSQAPTAGLATNHNTYHDTTTTGRAGRHY